MSDSAIRSQRKGMEFMGNAKHCGPSTIIALAEFKPTVGACALQLPILRNWLFYGCFFVRAFSGICRKAFVASHPLSAA